MSVWDDIGDVVEDIGDAVVDVAEDVAGAIADAAEAVAEAAEWVAEATAAAAEWTAEATVDAAAWAGEAALNSTDAFLTTLDDSGFFDVVDTVTVGLVELDYEDGNFSASFGIDDVFGVGVEVGEDGFGLDADYLMVHADIDIDDEGFGVAGAVGMDYGPLPYAEAHVSVDENANFGLGGEVHLYIPTPAGNMMGVEVEGDYQQTDDGFMVSGSATGGTYFASGTYAKGGVHASYEEDADGYRTVVGVHGEVGQVGVGSVKGSIDYVDARDGDVRTEGVFASGSVESDYGGEVSGSVGYQHVETPDGEYDMVTGEIEASYAGQTASASGGVAVGPDGEVTAWGEADVDLDADPMAIVGAAGELAGVGTDTIPGLDDATEAFGQAKDVLDDPLGSLGGAVGDELGDELGDALGDGLGDAVNGGLDDLGDEIKGQVSDQIDGAVDDFGDDIKGYVTDTVDTYVNDAVDDAEGAVDEYTGEVVGYVDDATGYVDDATGYVEEASGYVDDASGYVDDAVDYVEENPEVALADGGPNVFSDPVPDGGPNVFSDPVEQIDETTGG